MKYCFVIFTLVLVSFHSKAQFLSNVNCSFGLWPNWAVQNSYHSPIFYAAFEDALASGTFDHAAIEEKVAKPYSISTMLPIGLKDVPTSAMEFVSIYSEDYELKTAYYIMSNTGIQFLLIRVKDLEILFDAKGIYVLSVKRG